MDVKADRRITPFEVKIVVGVTVAAALVDAVTGFSSPALVVARIALGAGLLRGLEPFRQLLRVASAFALVGSVFLAAAKGAWLVGLFGFAAAACVVVMLGASQVRDWCGASRDRAA